MATRVDPPLRASEAEMLLAFLDYHRATLQQKVSGLDAEQLDRALAPSTMTLGGLLSHMTFVEDWWFSVTLSGRTAAPAWSGVDWEADNDYDWHVASGAELPVLMAAYEEAVERADGCVAAALDLGGLDTLSQREARLAGAGRFSLRWILIHMIEEYARHNGHADLLREAIDGSVGM